MKARRRTAVVLVGLIALLATACGGADTADEAADVSPAPQADRSAGSDQPAEQEETLLVVATTTQTADFARQIGGERVEVRSLVRPGVDAHDFEPSPADLESLSRADLVVRNGVGLETWLDDAMAASGASAPVVDASVGVALRTGSGHSHGHSHDDDGHGHDDDGHGHDDDGHGHSHDDDGHGHDDDGHGHSHDGEHDPHIWFDPRNAKVMATNIADGLVAADPDGAATYRANLAAYLEALDDLDAEIEQALAGLTNRKIVTNHDAFGYYIDRYGLVFVGAIIPSFDSSAELSAAQVSDLVARIRAADVRAIFSETSLPPRTAEAIAREAGVKVVGGEDALYGDSLGPEGSSGATYLDMMRHNTRVIVDNLS